MVILIWSQHEAILWRQTGTSFDLQTRILNKVTILGDLSGVVHVGANAKAKVTTLPDWFTEDPIYIEKRQRAKKTIHFRVRSRSV